MTNKVISIQPNTLTMLRYLRTGDLILGPNYCIDIFIGYVNTIDHKSSSRVLYTVIDEAGKITQRLGSDRWRYCIIRKCSRKKHVKHEIDVDDIPF